MDSLEVTEAECAKGRTAPRVSLDNIKASIATATYATADVAFGSAHADQSHLTLCLIVMHNGFTIIGKSAPASRDNFDAELGRKLAYEDAVRQIWPLMGFALRDRLAAA